MEIAAVGVVGLGTMGSGIVEVMTKAGLDVVAVEINDEFLEAGRGRLTQSLQRQVDRGRLDAADSTAMIERCRFTTDRGHLSSVDLVVEAVPETMAAKTDLFGDLAARCPATTVFATNTSSLSVTALAAATDRPSRVVGMHFFNPAPVMKLVEVVDTVLVDPDVAAAVVDLARRCGKTPVSVGDRAGFVANALLVPYLNHAAHLVETGRASVAALDAAMAELADLPMGPCALMDLIGLDVCVAILDVLWDEFRDRRYAVTPLLRRLAAAGFLGRKTKRGWYRYDGPEPAPAVGSLDAGAGDAAAVLRGHLADAVRMTEDGYATADDVDTAMRLGCGYRQGPFELLRKLDGG